MCVCELVCDCACVCVCVSLCAIVRVSHLADSTCEEHHLQIKLRKLATNLLLACRDISLL